MPAEGSAAGVDIVVKLGGSLLRDAPLHARALLAIEALARTHRVLIVAGGGPFADLVRELDRRLGLGDDLAHWLAIGAMDLHASIIAARLSHAHVVRGAEEIASAARDRVLVLAALDWLRDADPLPHSWDVTSDSIAAWVASAIRAPRLLLIKPRDGTVEDVTDPFFARARDPRLDVAVMSVTALDRLAGETA